MNELVLVVEDDAMNLKLTRDLLQVHGYRVLAADTAEEGLALAKAHQPRLALMDVQLPGMDGFAALAALRADPATRRLLVAAFTASVMREDIARITAPGFDGYIAKPISVKDFPEQVRRPCDQRRPGAP